jgi:hypothetical protein
VGIKAPIAIATPPILGTGSQWIFRLFGKSRKFSLQAKLMKIGISKIVIIVEIRNVENRIIIDHSIKVGYKELRLIEA